MGEKVRGPGRKNHFFTINRSFESITNLGQWRGKGRGIELGGNASQADTS